MKIAVSTSLRNMPAADDLASWLFSKGHTPVSVTRPADLERVQDADLVVYVGPLRPGEAVEVPGVHALGICNSFREGQDEAALGGNVLWFAARLALQTWISAIVELRDELDK